MVLYLIAGIVLTLMFFALLGRVSNSDDPATRATLIKIAVPVGILLGLMLLLRGQYISAGVIAAGALWGFLKRGEGRPSQSRSATKDMKAAAALLGVPVDASQADINDAWRRKMAIHHPDKGGDAEIAAKLNAARKSLLGKS